MIKLDPPNFGRPGDMLLTLSPVHLAYSDLTGSSAKYGGAVSVGVHLPDEDMRAVAGAMRESFAKAYPDAEGKPKLPIRRNREGTWLLFAETMKTPKILDEHRKPVDPPKVGATVRVMARIAPYRNEERGRQGVALYLNLLNVLTSAEARS